MCSLVAPCISSNSTQISLSDGFASDDFLVDAQRIDLEEAARRRLLRVGSWHCEPGDRGGRRGRHGGWGRRRWSRRCIGLLSWDLHCPGGTRGAMKGGALLKGEGFQLDRDRRRAGGVGRDWYGTVESPSPPPHCSNCGLERRWLSL